MRDAAQTFPVLRGTLVALVVVDLLFFFRFIGDARAAAIGSGAVLGPLLDRLSTPAPVAATVLAGVVGAAAFGLKAGRLSPGFVALAALALLSTVHAQLFGSPWRHLYYSGLVLLGWLLGLALARRRGLREDETLARVGAVALLAAAYFNAGISKLTFGGLDWTSGVTIQSVIVAQHGIVPGETLSDLRSWVVTTPVAARLFSVATVVVELAAPLMIVGGRLQAVAALALLAMHASIFAFTGIMYIDSMVLLVTFGVGAPLLAAPSATPVSSRAFNPAFAVSVLLLAVCAVTAIVHQGRRYEETRRAMPGEETRGTPVDRVGPFAVGSSLDTEASWKIESVRVAGADLLLTLSGRPGRTSFEVTCTESGRVSPFDLGAMHILYSRGLGFEALEPAGRAVREQIRDAAGGKDPCAALADWRRLALGDGRTGGAV